MNFHQLAAWSQLQESAKLVFVCDFIALAGILVCVLAGITHFRWARAKAGAAGEESAVAAPRAGAFARLITGGPLVLMYGAGIVLSFWVWFRWQEVNHFPSQTMSEVLTMFTLALVLSMVVLHHALGLHRRGPGWAILGDVLMLLIFVSTVFTHGHIRGLVTAQRDLPPALQSYWFPPHLSSLIFSYATLGIAGLICLVYFVTRFWKGVFFGGYSKTSQIVILLALALVPFAHIVTLPALALGGLIFTVLVMTGKMPGGEAMARLEKELDDVSFRAFAVGMPFLTAGLWMGAFWAQEAWANYWGWDSKENSALISWLIYVVYIHLRMLGGYRGERAMAVLMGGALSIFITFQVFGYMPDSQKSLHRYTDDGVSPQEGQQGMPESDVEQAAR